MLGCATLRIWTIDLGKVCGPPSLNQSYIEVSSKKWTPSPYDLRVGGGEMEHLPRQQYTKEFREQQVPIAEAARRLSMSGKTLKNWVGRARRGQLATLGENRRPVTELEAE